MKWRFIIPIVVFAGLSTVFVMTLTRTERGDYDPRAIPSPLIGKPAPKFRLSQVEDPAKFVDNAELVGRWYAVNVWATWCGGCREEHGVLLQIAQQNLIPIIGIDWNDDLDRAQRWLNSLGNPYAATAFDSQGKVAIDWGVYGAPETFLVDDKGVVQYKHVGPLTMDVWQKQFVSRIKFVN